MSENPFSTLPWPIETRQRHEMVGALARRMRGLEGNQTNLLAQVVTWYEGQAFLLSTDTTKYIAFIGKGVRFVNQRYRAPEIEHFISEKLGILSFATADTLEAARRELRTNIRAQLLLRASQSTMPSSAMPAKLARYSRGFSSSAARASVSGTLGSLQVQTKSEAVLRANEFSDLRFTSEVPLVLRAGQPSQLSAQTNLRQENAFAQQPRTPYVNSQLQMGLMHGRQPVLSTNEINFTELLQQETANNHHQLQQAMRHEDQRMSLPCEVRAVSALHGQREANVRACCSLTPSHVCDRRECSQAQDDISGQDPSRMHVQRTGYKRTPEGATHSGASSGADAAVSYRRAHSNYGERPVLALRNTAVPSITSAMTSRNSLWGTVQSQSFLVGDEHQHSATASRRRSPTQPQAFLRNNVAGEETDAPPNLVAEAVPYSTVMFLETVIPGPSIIEDQQGARASVPDTLSNARDRDEVNPRDAMYWAPVSSNEYDLGVIARNMSLTAALEEANLRTSGCDDDADIQASDIGLYQKEESPRTAQVDQDMGTSVHENSVSSLHPDAKHTAQVFREWFVEENMAEGKFAPVSADESLFSASEEQKRVMLKHAFGLGDDHPSFRTSPVPWGHTMTETEERTEHH